MPNGGVPLATDHQGRTTASDPRERTRVGRSVEGSARIYRTADLLYPPLSTPFHAPAPATPAARAWSHVSFACWRGVRLLR